VEKGDKKGKKEKYQYNKDLEANNPKSEKAQNTGIEKTRISLNLRGKIWLRGLDTNYFVHKYQR
jgi:hypothetical protein